MVLQVFENLNQKYSTTIIVVTHDTDIARIATKIIRVRNNAIQSVDTNIPVPIHEI
jgi:putative ABC transport system ATP-binding protein